jgi:hypothetical protein
MRGANQSADIARRVTFRERDAYGILHFIMRRIYLLGVNDRQESYRRGLEAGR